MLYLSAIFISSIAAWFSISGLISIFPAAVISIGLMGCALEIAKLVTASWLYRFWSSANVLIRIYFISAVIVLSFITSIGIFGYLTRAHADGAKDLNTNIEEIATINDQIVIENNIINTNRVTLRQLDAVVNTLLTNSRTTERAIIITNKQKNDRAAISSQIAASNAKIIELQQQKNALNKNQRNIEAEIGPIKYIAQLLYSSDSTETIEKSIRVLTLLLIFVFDPLAILMIVAANIEKKHPSISSTDDITNNITELKPEWSANSWFKIVKTPK